VETLNQETSRMLSTMRFQYCHEEGQVSGCSFFHLYPVLSYSVTPKEGSDRRRILPVASVAVVFALSRATDYAQLAETPWPMFHYDARRTGHGYFAEPSILAFAWSYKTGNAIMPRLMQQDCQYASRERLCCSDGVRGQVHGG